jgi:hypothetical protein
LHTQREGTRIRHADRFDQTVWRVGFDREAVAEPLDALAGE